MQGLTRRKVVTGAAWSVPVIALAAATPAHAASTVTPQPAPVGSSNFQAGVAIAKITAATPQRVNINTAASTVGFYVLDSEGAFEPDGGYLSGTVSFIVTWGPRGDGTGSADLALTTVDAKGWAIQGAPSTSGLTGSVTFIYTDLLNGNGVTNSVPLPQLRITPASGTALPTMRIDTELTATYLSSLYQGINIP